MKQSRREFIKTIGYGSAALSYPTLFSSYNGIKPPNILFIMSDDHAEQAISCYNNNLVQTPHIDRIAKEGVRFTNSFVTNSICAPSRAAILTGKYSHLNGLRDNRDEFDGSQLTFPKLLQKAGYFTSMIGKWHLKTTPTGFDDWKILIGQGEYYNPRIVDNGEQKKLTGYTTDLLTDIAIDTLDNRDTDKPFCMMMHHKAPHRNWMPNGKYLGAINGKDIPLPETLFDDYKNRPAAEAADMRINDMFLSFDLKLQPGFYDHETGTGGSTNDFAANAVENWKKTYESLTSEQRKTWDNYYLPINEEYKSANLSGKELTEWKYRRYMEDYLSCILSVDESVGRMLDYLDKNGLAENTIVVYTSDQGFYLGEHGWYDKRFMYEESLGMPLLMRYPRAVKGGQVSEKMALNIDFGPTFLEYAGLQVPEEMQGTSLRPVLKSTDPEWRDSIYYHYYEYPHGWHRVKKHYGIRTEKYKLIHFYDDIDEWELYNLEKDPHELQNVYNDPSYQQIRTDLKNQLIALQKKYKEKPDIIRLSEM